MEIEVKEPKKLEDGPHEGEIISVAERSFEDLHKNPPETYTYIDLLIKSSEGADLKWSCPKPATIWSGNKLGKLLANFVSLESVDKLDPEKILKGRKVVFQTTTETRNGQDWSVVLDKTLKPKDSQDLADAQAVLG